MIHDGISYPNLAGNELPVRLKAGPLEMLLFQSAIRKIKLGKTEIVRAVYAAVRDKNWATIPFKVVSSDLSEQVDSFNLKIKGNFGINETLGFAEIEISGNTSGKLEFQFNFVASSSFLKNRIGICVLLPVEECIGMKYQLFQQKENKVSGRFHELIVPHQPLLEISALEWETPDKNIGRLEFEGDIFEMEDQRNWIDASFKIYSTPLSIPYPAEIRAGEFILQKVKLSLPVIRKLQTQKEINEITLTGKKCRFPEIGVCLGKDNSFPRKELKEAFSELPFQHVRAELNLADPNADEQLRGIFSVARDLGCKLELALHCKNGKGFPSGLLEILIANKLELCRILVFNSDSFVSNGAEETGIISILRQTLRTIKIGGGSNANFAEFNRNRLSVGSVDFVSTAANPQVHAEDEMSIIENIEGLNYVIQSMMALYPDVPVLISPISYKPRFNAVAFDTESLPVSGSEKPVSSLQGDFGALWTLAAIKRIALSGAESLTLHELTGENGIIQPVNFSNDGILPKSPLYNALKCLSGFTKQHFLLESCSTSPEETDSLIFQNEVETVMLILSFAEQERTITLPEFFGKADIIKFSNDNSQKAVLENERIMHLKGRQLLMVRYR